MKKGNQELTLMFIDEEIQNQDLNQTKVTISDKTSNSEDQYMNEASFIGVRFTKFDKKSQRKVTLGKYDPKRKHLSVCNGLNFKGKCFNQNCLASKHPEKTSWINKGYGTFLINKEVMKNSCQTCEQKILAKNVTSLGFTRAKLNISGAREDQDGEQITFNLQLIEREGKFVYWTDFDDEVVQWQYLQVQVTKVE